MLDDLLDSSIPCYTTNCCREKLLCGCEKIMVTQTKLQTFIIIFFLTCLFHTCCLGSELKNDWH